MRREDGQAERGLQQRGSRDGDSGAKRRYENGVKKKKVEANYREKRGGTRGAALLLRRGEERRGVSPRGCAAAFTRSLTRRTTRWKKRTEGPGGKEGWRHGNSGLAFNVPYRGVTEDTRREAGAKADSKRARRELELFLSLGRLLRAW